MVKIVIRSSIRVQCSFLVITIRSVVEIETHDNVRKSHGGSVREPDGNILAVACKRAQSCQRDLDGSVFDLVVHVKQFLNECDSSRVRCKGLGVEFVLFTGTDVAFSRDLRILVKLVKIYFWSMTREFRLLTYRLVAFRVVSF